MKLKDGNEAVPTVAGLFFSIFLPVMLLSYSYNKFDILINKKDSKIFQTDLINSIPETEVFDTEMGLKIAVAFTEWDDNPDPILDKSYGRIVFYRETYSIDANHTVFYDHVELPSHYCSAEELNLEKSPESVANVFFPIAQKYERDMKAYHKKFLCLDEEDMRLQGDYSSETASLLEVRIEKCQGHDYCRDETEIDDFFKADKYIILLNN